MHIENPRKAVDTVDKWSEQVSLINLLETVYPVFLKKNFPIIQQAITQWN
jgi:hypothetical protein